MNPDKLFDYLEGRLTSSERAALEERLMSDKQLQREFAVARQIHAGMRGDSHEVVLPAPPDVPPPRARAHSVDSSQPGCRGTAGPWGRVACYGQWNGRSGGRITGQAPAASRLANGRHPLHGLQTAPPPDDPCQRRRSLCGRAHRGCPVGPTPGRSARGDS